MDQNLKLITKQIYITYILGYRLIDVPEYNKPFFINKSLYLFDDLF